MSISYLQPGWALASCGGPDGDPPAPPRRSGQCLCARYLPLHHPLPPNAGTVFYVSPFSTPIGPITARTTGISGLHSSGDSLFVWPLFAMFASGTTRRPLRYPPQPRRLQTQLYPSSPRLQSSGPHPLSSSPFHGSKVFNSVFGLFFLTTLVVLSSSFSLLSPLFNSHLLTSLAS